MNSELLSSVAVTTALFLAGGVYLLTTALRLGATALRIEQAQVKLSKHIAALEILPELAMRIGTLESAVQKNSKDIASLTLKAARGGAP